MSPRRESCASAFRLRLRRRGVSSGDFHSDSFSSWVLRAFHAQPLTLWMRGEVKSVAKTKRQERRTQSINIFISQSHNTEVSHALFTKSSRASSFFEVSQSDRQLMVLERNCDLSEQKFETFRLRIENLICLHLFQKELKNLVCAIESVRSVRFFVGCVRGVRLWQS